MESKFNHYDLELVTPDFNSSLTATIIELEELRNRRLMGKVHPLVFFQLKEIFHLLESFGSARIEGNNTTLSELVEKQIEGESDEDEKFKEIKNTEKAMTFIEDNVKKGTRITKALILELHKIVVEGLKREGDTSPGSLRAVNVKITKSAHMPPLAVQVDSYLDELFEFINKKVDKQYELLVTVISHHRFAWIHPFRNGNGRVVRLLTYAMLIKQGFIKKFRIINPTAVFCVDRKKYYEMLDKADRGSQKNILTWSEYVLNGLLKEISKIDKLLDRNYLLDKILLPALLFNLERENITKLEFDILKLALTTDKMEVQSSHLKSLFPNKTPETRSRYIAKLRNKKMLSPTRKNGRKYVVFFTNNYLLRGVIESLKKENFVSSV